MALRTPYRNLPLLALACIASTTLYTHAQAVEATAPKASQAVEPAAQPNKPPPPAPAADYRFEVISIHPVDPFSPRSAGNRAMYGPDRYQSGNTTICGLAFRAFGLKHSYELECPKWTENAYFFINATMPEGATQKDLPIMIRHLLEDRFGLVFHTKATTMSGFDMVKVKPGTNIAPSAGPIENGGHPFQVKNGEPEFGKDVPSMRFVSNSNGIFKGIWHGRDMDMDGLTRYVSDALDVPVGNSTDLPGKYDFTLSFTPQSTPVNIQTQYPFLREALEQQLGIKLQPKKNVPVTVYVIDKLLKSPTEN